MVSITEVGKMTIHHDKLAYGKLASTRENVSEERIAEMLKKLSEEEEKEKNEKPEKKADE